MKRKYAKVLFKYSAYTKRGLYIISCIYYIIFIKRIRDNGCCLFDAGHDFEYVEQA